MNVLLVRPPDPMQHVGLLSHTRPMNLACLAAHARSNGFSVRIIDLETVQFSTRKFYDILQETGPSVIGVSCVTPTINSGAYICDLAKSFDPGIVTVVGGPHSSSLPEQTLREFPSFDYVVRGEGEITFTDLCRHLDQGSAGHEIPGLAYRDHKAIIRNPGRELICDLDSLPFPARDLIDYSLQPGHSTRGFSNNVISTELFTSRGCPFGCSFCAIQATFGKSVRFRSLDSIRDEVGHITKDNRFRHIVIADDTFSLSAERAFGICGILGDSGIPSWSCDTRVTSVSLELLKAMKQSGCKKVSFGVESGSQRILDRIGKKINTEQVRQAVAWAKEAGIRHIEGNFIIGSDPSETMQDVKMTEDLIRTIPWTFVSVSVIVPYPGTPVYDQMLEMGLIHEDTEWEDYVMFGLPPKWHTPHFSASELLRLQKRLSNRFYLKPGFILRQLSSIRSWADVRYWASAGISYATWHLRGRV